MATLSPEDEARIRAEEELRQEIRKGFRAKTGRNFAVGCATIIGSLAFIVFILLILPGGPLHATKDEPLPAIKEVRASTPCTQTHEQLAELIRLSRDRDHSVFAYRQAILVQEGQSILVEPGANVRVQFEMEGVSRIEPFTGQHAGASACYVPTSSLK